METPAIIKIVMNWYNKTTVYIPTLVFVYIGVSLLHFACANLYPYLCTPLSFMGLFMTPFMVVTPHCLAIRWVIDWTGNQICNAWIWLGGYLVYYIGKYITPYIQEKQKNSENISLEIKED